MNTIAFDVGPERFSPRALARVFGGIGLFGIAAGFFDIGYVYSHVMASGDAAATAANLLAHQTMFHAGLSLHLFMVLLNVVAAVIAFHLFRRVNPLVATVALCCAVVGAATESLDMLGSVLPLQIAGAGAMPAFGAAQRDVLTYVSLRLQHTGLLVSFLFWGLDELLTGYLMFRSGFLPRTLGVLLGISGFLYLVDPLSSFAAPALAAVVFPYALALCLPGEFLTALWMATVGLNADGWRAWFEPQRCGWSVHAPQ